MLVVSVELVVDTLAGSIEVGGWQPRGTVRQAVDALVGALRVLGNGLIWVDAMWSVQDARRMDGLVERVLR